MLPVCYLTQNRIYKRKQKGKKKRKKEMHGCLRRTLGPQEVKIKENNAKSQIYSPIQRNKK